MSELMPKSAPALVFVKDLSTWFIVNNKGKPIMWMDDHGELTWFFARILECGASEQKRLVVKKVSTKALSQSTQSYEWLHPIV